MQRRKGDPGRHGKQGRKKEERDRKVHGVRSRSSRSKIFSVTTKVSIVEVPTSGDETIKRGYRPLPQREFQVIKRADR